MTLKQNLIAWGTFTVGSFILIAPFLYGEWLKHISLSILIGFTLSLLNAICQNTNLGR